MPQRRVVGHFVVALILSLATPAVAKEDRGPRDCRDKPTSPPRLEEISWDEFEIRLLTRKKWLDAHPSARFHQWQRADEYSCHYDPDEPGGLERIRITAQTDGNIRPLSFEAQDGLRGACLRGADLRNLDLTNEETQTGADLSGANLYKSDLRGMDLSKVNLSNAVLYKTDLTEVELPDAVLIGVNLNCANLTLANLEHANLSEAILYRTLLDRAFLGQANVTGARYEAISTPLMRGMYEVTGLRTLYFVETAVGLELLRTALKTAGLRAQEREVTYAIKHTEESAAKAGAFEHGFTFVLFEWTSDWGMDPWRPFWWFVYLIPISFFVYLCVLTFGKGTIERVITEGTPPHTKEQVIDLWVQGGRSIYWYVFYFSLLSAFRIGWRELNFGEWISRMQLHDYSLRGTKAIRTLSGIQSLLSVYLLALWVLTYFGRPFE